MNVKNEKPPIGIAPFYVVDGQRMIELSNAIYRYLPFATTTNDMAEAASAYKKIALWANELAIKAETEIMLIKAERGEK